MGIVASLLGGILVLGAPAWAAVRWVEARRGESLGPAASAAVAYSGLGIACTAVWLAASLAGLSTTVILAAVVVAVAALLLDARRLRAIVARQPERRAGPAPDSWLLVATALILVALASSAFVSFGLARGDGVHTLAMTDWYKHLLVTAGIDGTSAFPPANPFLSGHTEPSYYFGFHLLAASIRRVLDAEIDVYWILLALTLLSAAAFPPVVYLFGRDLVGARSAVIAAVGASLLAGFDLIVVAIDTLRNVTANWPIAGGLAGLRAVIPSTHLDYWVHHNERQFNGAYVATVWAPQHAAAVLLALLVIWLLTPRAKDSHGEQNGWLLPAMLIAALPAISAYVALALAFGVASYVALEALRRRVVPWRTVAVRRWMAPGLAGALLALPVVRVLSSSEGAGSGFVLGISGSGGWSNGAIFNALFGTSWWTNLLDTPAVYAVELGAIGLLGAIEIVRRSREGRLSEPQLQCAAIAGAILLLVTFVRPPIDAPNNLYARPMLLVFCLLAPFAAIGLPRVRRAPVVAAVLIGLLGTGYAAVGNLLQGTLFWSTEPGLADAGVWINENTPRDDAVAVHPEDFNRYFGFWTRRPFVLADARHALLLGASEEQYAATSQRLVEAYSSVAAEEAARRFEALGADTIIIRAGPAASPWAEAPCFDIGHRNADWLVVQRRGGSCADGAPRPAAASPR